jgi:hypothetical protein
VRRTLILALAVLALAEGPAMAGAATGHEARQASLVTVELMPGLDVSTQRTVELAPGGI